MPTDEARSALHCAQARLLLSLKNQEEFWSQKAGVKWLKEGDSNTSFFHASVREKRMKLMIHKIKDSAGTWIEDDEQIAAEAVNFFRHLLATEEVGDVGRLLQNIPPLVSSDNNIPLLHEITMEAVKGVVFGLH